MDKFTLICPYYRQAGMLEYQVAEWNHYPPEVDVIVVDDCSPEPAEDVIRRYASPRLLEHLQLYRIGVDIPWNRACARNLGCQQSETDWLLLLDTDHVLRADQARLMLESTVKSRCWYRFERYRRGEADDTRNKDAIPRDCPYGRIHPHIDAIFLERALYWEIGGADEDYSGCLGGGTVFLRALSKVATPQILDGPYLEVVTRSVVADSSISTLSRSHTEFRRRQLDKKTRGDIRPQNPVRCPWTRLL